jgi:two-component system chemotaxis response regulator CheB
LPEILTRSGHLRAVNARDQQRLEPGLIYVAPPDCHLLVEPGKVRVTRGPRENRFRPAIDPLFRSAATAYGPATIGVILTGNLDDGAAGLWIVKQLGGIAVVQDPADAMFPSMPAHALSRVDVDYSVPSAEIGPLLAKLVAQPAEAREGPPVPEHVDVEVKIANEENPREAGLERLGEPSPYTCPECHGVLLQLQEGGRIRFRCHTGHAYSVDSLLADINEGIEQAMGVAVRALEEGSLLMKQMADHFTEHHGNGATDRLATSAGQAHRHSDAIRSLLRERERPSD